MRRIYLESFVGLIILFMASLWGYEFLVYEINTDYDYLLQEHEGQAFHDLIYPIYKEHGLEYTQQQLEQFATSSHRLLVPHTLEELPTDIKKAFESDTSVNVAYDEERDIWFRLDASTPIFKMSDNPNSPVVKAANFDDNIVWLFFLAGFALYCILLIWFLSRRIRELERVTVEFASGNFKARASTSSAKSVGTLNKSFNTMADKVSRLITSNKMLTNAVAHELRTPIFRLQWQADLLSDSTLTEQQKKYVYSIVEDIDEMEEMVEELLYYAKMKRPDTALQTQEEVVLFNLVKELRQRWQKETTLGISLQEVNSENVLAFADPKLLKRALDNLLRNAMRYADKQILVEIKHDQHRCFINVHDDGIGIEEKHWPHLFEPFYSADESRNKKTSGFGLGLAIVRQIMELQRGEVSICHSPLGGACFTLSLKKSDS